MQKLIARALSGGLSEAFKTSHGIGRGVRFNDKVLFLTGAAPQLVAWVTSRAGAASLPMRPFALCTCGEVSMMPVSPTSQGLNGAGEPLLAPGTSGHALHVLTWLTAFARQHGHSSSANDESR